MQRRSTSLVCRAVHTTNTDKMTKTGGNAKQTDFLHIANQNAKWHNMLENREAFFYQVKYTFNHITKQVHNICSQKRFALLMSKMASLQ